MTTSMLTKRFLHLTQFITGGPSSGCFYGPFLNDTKTTGAGPFMVIRSRIAALLFHAWAGNGWVMYRDNQPWFVGDEKVRKPALVSEYTTLFILCVTADRGVSNEKIKTIW